MAGSFRAALLELFDADILISESGMRRLLYEVQITGQGSTSGSLGIVRLQILVSIEQDDAPQVRTG